MTESGERFLQRSVVMHPRNKVVDLCRRLARLLGAPPLSQTLFHEGNRINPGVCLEDAILDPDGHHVESCALTLEIDESTRYFATGSVDRTAILWNADSGEIVRTYKGHINSVNTVAFSSDAFYLVTASDDHTARLWNVLTGQSLETYHKNGHAWAVNSAAFSPDDEYVCTASHDKKIKLWKTRSEACYSTIEGHQGSVSSAVFNPDGHLILSASHDKTAALWDVETGERRLTFIGHKDMVFAATFSVDASLVLTSSGDRTARLWCPESANCLKVFRSGHKGCVVSAVFSQDSESLLTTSEDHVSLRLFNIATGDSSPLCPNHASRAKKVGSFTNYAGPFNSSMYSYDGKSVLAGSIDRTIKHFDVETGEVLRIFRGHGGGVVSTIWSPESVETIPEPPPSEPHDLEFTIHLNAADGSSHGLDVRLDISARRLQIFSILGGLAQKWNDKHPFDKIFPGDFIDAVNGTDGYGDRMAARLNAQEELEITIVREVCLDTFFEVTLDTSGYEDLGWELANEFDEGRRAEVDVIFGGLAEKWNKLNKGNDEEIREKDVIYNVNGVTGDYNQILAELGKNQALNIQLVREAPKDLYFDIVFDYGAGELSLGWEISEGSDGESLTIDAIAEAPDSLVGVWNQTHPKRQVQVGDVIIAVNDIRFDASRMLSVCQDPNSLRRKCGDSSETTCTCQDLLRLNLRIFRQVLFDEEEVEETSQGQVEESDAEDNWDEDEDDREDEEEP